MPDPIGIPLNVTPEEIVDVSAVALPLEFSGACWQAADLKPNGNFTKLCGESGQTDPCTMKVTYTNGMVYRYTFACTTIPANQGGAEKAGSTYVFRKAASKMRIE